MFSIVNNFAKNRETFVFVVPLKFFEIHKVKYSKQFCKFFYYGNTKSKTEK